MHMRVGRWGGGWGGCWSSGGIAFCHAHRDLHAADFKCDSEEFWWGLGSALFGFAVLWRSGGCGAWGLVLPGGGRGVPGLWGRCPGALSGMSVLHFPFRWFWGLGRVSGYRCLNYGVVVVTSGCFIYFVGPK